MGIDINKQETSKQTLDLSGYKYVKFWNIEFLMNKINEEKNKKKSIWKYWWISKDNNYIITITTENSKLEFHELSKTTINLTSHRQENVVETTKQSLLNNLTLNLGWENFVKDEKEAKEQAQKTAKKIFWYVSKDRYTLDGKDKKERSIVVLNFSANRNNPTITKYPLDIYTPKETVKI